MNSNILEYIIKSVLLEDRIVAKTGDRIDNKNYSQLLAAGAKHAFTVLVKGVSSKNKILSYAQRAIAKSFSENLERKISVGEQSTFANGKFVYIISDPKGIDKQNLIVAIFNNPGILTKTQTEKEKERKAKDAESIINPDASDVSGSQDEKEVKLTTPILTLFIGESPLITLSNYNKAIDQLNLSSNISSNISSLFKTISTDKDDDKKSMYPFDWKVQYKDNLAQEYGPLTITWRVFTTTQNNLVYIKSGNSWFSCKKSLFEKEYKRLDSGDLFNNRETNIDIINELNKQYSGSDYPIISRDKFENIPTDVTTLINKPEPTIIEPSLTQMTTQTQSDNSADTKPKTPADGYPFTYKTQDGHTFPGKEYIVYTMSPTDDYVYFKVDNKWYFFGKREFEQNEFYKKLFQYIDREQIGPGKGLRALNQAGIKNVETKFGLSTSNTQTQGDQTPKPTPPPPKPESKEYKAGDLLKFKDPAGKQIPVYKLEKNGYKQIKKDGKPQVWTISSDWKTNKTEQLRYIKSSSDKQWYQVKTSSGTNFWMKAYYFTK